MRVSVHFDLIISVNVAIKKIITVRKTQHLKVLPIGCS